jgi:hypothetical protein
MTGNGRAQSVSHCRVMADFGSPEAVALTNFLGAIWNTVRSSSAKIHAEFDLQLFYGPTVATLQTP